MQGTQAKNDKKKKKIFFWTSKQPVTTGRQRRCDTIIGRTSCLVPNTKATGTEDTEDTFHIFFDENIKSKIVGGTNNRINETIAHLQRVESYNKSINKYTRVKVTDKIVLDALFGLMYFRGLRGVDLHLTDDYYHQTVTLFGGYSIPI